MDMDLCKVHEILGDNSRFISPFSDPCGYYIWTGAGERRTIGECMISLYWDCLNYAAVHADALIGQVFDALQKNVEMNRRIPGFSPDMRQKLRFESFVLEPEPIQISSCLSNPEIMFGHFLACCWDLEWNLLYFYYC